MLNKLRNLLSRKPLDRVSKTLLPPSISTMFVNFPDTSLVDISGWNMPSVNSKTLSRNLETSNDMWLANASPDDIKRRLGGGAATFKPEMTQRPTDKYDYKEGELGPEYIYADTIISVDSYYMSGYHADAILLVKFNVLKERVWDEKNNQLDLEKLVSMGAVKELSPLRIETGVEVGDYSHTNRAHPALKAIDALRAKNEDTDVGDQSEQAREERMGR